MTDGQKNLLASPKGPRGQGKFFVFALAHPIYVSNSHTKFRWNSSNGLGGNSLTVGQTDGGDCNKNVCRIFAERALDIRCIFNLQI